MKQKTSMEILLKDDSPILLFKRLEGGAKIELRSQDCLVGFRRPDSAIYGGRGGVRTVPKDGQWYVVNGDEQETLFGLSSLVAYSCAEYPGERFHFGFSGKLRYRFAHSSGLGRLIELAGWECDSLTAQDAVRLLAPLLKEEAIRLLASLAPEEDAGQAWRDETLYSIRPQIADGLGSRFTEIFLRYGLLLTKDSVRITGYAQPTR